LHYLLLFATVHFMNNGQHNDQENLRSFLLMSELESGEPVTQREIAGRLGIALGLVNSYLKTLAAKGFVTVKAMPRNRFAYLLTPKGFAEKSRLAFQHLSNFNKLYRITRQDSLARFQSMRERGVERVAFCGLDDLTEIAYLSLREAQIGLDVVMDEEAGGRFIDYPVVSLEEGVVTVECPIVITSLQRAGELKAALNALGVKSERIFAPSFSFDEALSGNSK
jgi:DNA-binding MarR family transcriptional regulator